MVGILHTRPFILMSSQLQIVLEIFNGILKNSFLEESITDTTEKTLCLITAVNFLMKTSSTVECHEHPINNLLTMIITELIESINVQIFNIVSKMDIDCL